MSRKPAFGGVTPCLMYSDANAALEWLERVLGFRETERYVDKDGVVGQAHVRVGDAEVWIGGRPGHEPDPADQTWGVRNFHVKDPGDYYWSFAKGR